MNQTFVIKGPMVIPVLALCAIAGWFRYHDYARSDLAAAYSGTVVDEGTDYHLLGRPTWHYYIVIRDSAGKREKRYVDRSGYMSVQVGAFVVKQAGLDEDPRMAADPKP